MGYYYFPRKQKSQRTIEKNKAIKEYGKIVSQKQLEKLSNKELSIQKELFEDELNQHTSTYSVSNFEKKTLLLNDYVERINDINNQLLSECKKYRKLIRIKLSYYKENAWWFPTCLVINQITIQEDLKNLIKIEKNLFKILEDKEYFKIKTYFYDIQSKIEKHFLIYDLNLSKNNKISGTDLTYYNSRKNASFSPNLSFQSVIDEILNKEPTGEGGYYFGLDYSFQKFLNSGGKVPTYGDLDTGKWKKTLNSFSKCQKSDHKHAEVILRFDEINYKNEAAKFFDFTKYYERIKNGYYVVGTIIDSDFYRKYFHEAKDAINKSLRKIELIQRSRLKRYEKETNVGYVYILTSEGYPGMYKVGSTYGLPEERAEELSGTNVPDPWVVTGKFKFKNAEYYEKISHKLMSNYRYRKDREFFKVDLKKIKQTLNFLSEASEKGENKIKLSDLKKNFVKDF